MSTQHPTARAMHESPRDSLEQDYREGRITRRHFVTLLAAATTALTFGGSVREARAAAERRADLVDHLVAPRRGGVLKAALTGQPDQLDPTTANIYTSVQIYDNIFDKLIVFDAKGNFLPNLATKWRQLDAKTWEFNLVQNAVFHNGEPFTSADVQYTFARVLDPKVASPNAPGFSSLAAVQAVDKYTVRFHLKQPFGPFLTNLASNGGHIVNQKAISSVDPKRQPIGTGPFKFKEWISSDHITLERWPQYFQSGKPYVDSVIFRGLPVDESRMAALQSGEVNWVDAVPLQDVTRLRKGTNPVYVTANNAGIPDFLTFAVDKPPFNNKKLRQAIAWAVDKRAILAVAYFGVGEIGYQEVPTGSPWYTNNSPYRTPDLAKAQQLLHQAGYPNGLTIEYLGLPQYPELLKTGEIVKEQLAQIGITMNIKQLEVTVWGGRLVKRQYQITSAYAAGTIDPDNFYSGLLTSDATLNYTGFTTPQMDALVKQAKATTDPAARKALYAKVRAIMYDEVPNIFVHYETLNYAMQPRVHGSEVLPSLEVRLKNVWLG